MSRSSPTRSDSPQLNPRTCSEYSDRITQRNKRKTPHDDENILTIKDEVGEIKHQMSQMMALLSTFGNSQKEFMDKISSDVTSMKEQISDIKSITNNIITDQNDVKKKVEGLESEIKLLKTAAASSESSETQTTEAIVEEINERKRRNKSIIVVGIPEPTSTQKEERIEIDKTEITKVLQKICSNLPEPEWVMRLGKYNPTKKRGIKITFKSQEPCKNILRNKNKIVSEDIKIYSDQTPQQKTFLRKLAEELKFRTDHGEKNLVIKYVKGVPKIIISQPKN